MVQWKRLTIKERKERKILEKEKARIYFREYYKRHKEKILEKNRKRAKDNKELMKQYSRKSRAKARKNKNKKSLDIM